MTLQGTATGDCLSPSMIAKGETFITTWEKQMQNRKRKFEIYEIENGFIVEGYEINTDMKKVYVAKDVIELSKLVQKLYAKEKPCACAK